jgi:hypothetical protein
VGVLGSYCKKSTEDAWDTIIKQTSVNIKEEVERHLDAVIFSSRFVPLMATPNHLLSYFDYYNIHSGYNFKSIGYLTNSSKDEKYLWKVDEYETACAQYCYYYCNETSYPLELGYCTEDRVVDFSTEPVHQEPTSTLTKEEQLMLSGMLKETFLPIQKNGNTLTLTHETGRWHHYVAFAEIELSTLQRFIAFNTSTNVYIVDNLNNNVVIMGQQQPLLYTRNFVVSYTGLSWTVVIQSNDLYGDLYYKLAIACLVCAVSTLLLLIISSALIYYWITRPMKQKRDGLDQRTYTPFTDFD